MIKPDNPICPLMSTKEKTNCCESWCRWWIIDKQACAAEVLAKEIAKRK